MLTDLPNVPANEYQSNEARFNDRINSRSNKRKRKKKEEMLTNE